MNSNLPSGYSNMPSVWTSCPGNGFLEGLSLTFITNTFFLYVSVIFMMVPLNPLKLNLAPSLKYDAMILLQVFCFLLLVLDDRIGLSSWRYEGHVIPLY